MNVKILRFDCVPFCNSCPNVSMLRCYDSYDATIMAAGRATLISDMEFNSGLTFGWNQTDYIDVVSKYLVVKSKSIFKCNGSFEELKSLMNVLTDQETKWTAPGGNCKLLETHDTTVRWYYSNNSLTINGTASEDIKSKLNKIANLCHSEACATDNNSTQTEEDVVDPVQMDLSEACRCTCISSNRVINADLEGIKLDTTILESRLLAALSEIMACTFYWYQLWLAHLFYYCIFYIKFIFILKKEVMSFWRRSQRQRIADGPTRWSKQRKDSRMSPW